MTRQSHTDAVPQGRLPDFFIVGQPKCGTTALHNVLRRHPQIFMPAMKEPRFFERAANEPPSPRPPGAGRTPRTLAEYLALFEPALPAQLVGEASPSYLLSPYAADRIAQAQPGAKIIAILREPASLLRSLHLQLLQIHAENELDLMQAIALEPARREGRHLPPQEYWADILQYSSHVRYVEQLRRYEARFSPEQMLVLIYDDFRRDNAGVLRRILDFLGVDDTHAVDIRPNSNPAVAVRAQRLYDLIHLLSTGDGAIPRAVQRVVGSLAPKRLSRRSAIAVRNRLFYAPPPPPEEALVAELRGRFEPEVVALGEHLNRDLVALWGYDEIA